VLAARNAKNISEIELNPVLAHPEGQGVTIVDALVVGKSLTPSAVVPAKAGTHMWTAPCWQEAECGF
jgi:hypothetical protein